MIEKQREIAIAEAVRLAPSSKLKVRVLDYTFKGYVALLILVLAFSGIQLYKLKTTLEIDIFPTRDVLPDEKIARGLDNLHF